MGEVCSLIVLCLGRQQEASAAGREKPLQGLEQVDPELHDKYLEEQHRANELAEEVNGMHSQMQELQKQV